MAVEIDAFYSAEGDFEQSGMPVVMKILGESRNIASNLAFLQADVYYHRGIEHPDDEHEDCMSPEAGEEKHIHKGPERTLAHLGVSQVFSKDPLLWISSELNVDSHTHIGSDDIKEIVPWLYFAHKLDPHNVEVYTITAYYLANRLGKTSEAVSFLKRGMVLNPDSWELCAEMGLLMYKNVKDSVSAIRFLRRANALLDQSPHDRYDRRRVLTPLANAYLEAGDRGKALDVFMRIEDLAPESVSVKQKINELKNTLSIEKK
jgi:tetratricopeptide (TPR) repeat protein